MKNSELLVQCDYKNKFHLAIDLKGYLGGNSRYFSITENMALMKKMLYGHRCNNRYRMPFSKSKSRNRSHPKKITIRIDLAMVPL